jgi:hypothetical protein
MEMVRAYDDGWRVLVVVTEGPKWTSLVTLGDLRHQKVETAKFRREMRPEPLSIPEERILRKLRKRRRMFKRAGCTYSPVVDSILKEESNGR